MAPATAGLSLSPYPQTPSRPTRSYVAALPAALRADRCELHSFRRIHTPANMISYRFSVDLMVPAERVIVSSGQTKVYHATGSSGKFVKRHFCGDCGSCVYSCMLYSHWRLTVVHFRRPIFSDLENTPGIAFVKGGLFCASGFDLPPPRAQLFWRNHEDWETSIEGVALQE